MEDGCVPDLPSVQKDQFSPGATKLEPYGAFAPHAYAEIQDENVSGPYVALHVWPQHQEGDAPLQQFVGIGEQIVAAPRYFSGWGMECRRCHHAFIPKARKSQKGARKEGPETNAAVPVLLLRVHCR